MAMTLGDFVREARKQINEWDADTAKDNLEEEKVLVVDIREPYEFEKSHLPGAICIPRGLLEGAADAGTKYRDERLCHAQDETILLYCQSGGRSALAALTLQQMGFATVYNLAGGVELWDAEGYPLEK
ncbi:rhodanese-like domain-containing protein [Sulfurirhabdus autotrophica]|uniref:Rhodanese-related sulfurtransferase n=1 Tax=Sulfurirhabdus autotrophica TaxID=1706046 RepID=A0A4R3Y905_9PROT|nr:rhodanese-like domain-containing protein [Sulfurirhabdus autotrophica]TCV88061.1 rhodanese-related sulfurtransferase [Sulfurirhabdus autotrophica]